MKVTQTSDQGPPRENEAEKIKPRIGTTTREWNGEKL